MSDKYIELYKKYRPKRWEDIIGQETVVTPIKNAIKSNKIPTGYIFSGLAGTGKTTLALLIAKVLNCHQLDENMNPIEDDITRAIDNDSLIGVKQISMANATVEDVRKIMAESFISQPIKKKVFILDEFHNCSKAAFESILTDLESTNQDSLFICCTTEPDKIPKSIKSRMQQFSLRIPTANEILNVLQKIAMQEPEILKGIKEKRFTKEDFIHCVQNSGGSVRDAISNLENLVNGGIISSSYSRQLLENILNGNLIEIYKTTKAMSDSGANFHTTSETLYKSIIDLILLHSKVDVSDSFSCQDFVSISNPNTLLKMTGELEKTFHSISSKTIDYRILYEMCYIKMALLCKAGKQ